MVKVNYIKYDKRIINNYDLIVCPYNDYLKRDNNLIRYPKSIDSIKDTITLNDGDIKIVKYHNNMDIMFVNIPYYKSDHYYGYAYYSICYKVLSLIKMNEYKEVLFPNRLITYYYGIPMDYALKVNDYIYKYIYWFFEKENIYIDIPL